MMGKIWAFALIVLATGCCKQKDSDDPGPISISGLGAAGSKANKPATTLTVANPAAPDQPPANQPSSGYAPDGLPTDIPSTFPSTPPSVDEWNAVPREISVARSTPLNCETKMRGAWLRVSCRPKNNTGGTPTNVVHKLGPNTDTYYFAKQGIASLVTPVTRGKHAEYRFSWTDKTQTLVMDWPHGAPRPVIKFTD